MTTQNNKNVFILAFTLMVVMLGFGIVIPIMPFYIENLGAGGTELGLLAASYAVMRLFFGPMWGSLSDRVGRKPVLMIGILGYGITMFWFGMATQLPDRCQGYSPQRPPQLRWRISATAHLRTSVVEGWVYWEQP